MDKYSTGMHLPSTISLYPPSMRCIRAHRINPLSPVTRRYPLPLSPADGALASVARDGARLLATAMPSDCSDRSRCRAHRPPPLSAKTFAAISAGPRLRELDASRTCACCFCCICCMRVDPRDSTVPLSSLRSHSAVGFAKCRQVIPGCGVVPPDSAMSSRNRSKTKLPPLVRSVGECAPNAPPRPQVIPTTTEKQLGKYEGRLASRHDRHDTKQPRHEANHSTLLCSLLYRSTLLYSTLYSTALL